MIIYLVVSLGQYFQYFVQGANTGLVILELFVLLGCIFDIIACCNLDEKFYKLIRLGREK